MTVEGMSVINICKAIGITRKSYYEWKATKPEFAEAIAEASERAYDEMITMARQALRERIEGYTVEESVCTYVPQPMIKKRWN